MKTLFTFILSGLVAVSAFAADVAGRITVSFTGNKDYQVIIDGRSYATDNRIFLNDVRPGRHTIEVYPYNRNNRRKSAPLYSGSFTVRSQYDMNIRVLPNGKVQFDEKRTGNNRNDRNDRGWQDRDDRDWRSEDSRDNRDWRDRDSRDERDWRDNGTYNNDYNRAMSEADFSQFLQRIRSQLFGKMNTARDGISRNYFTTQQVRQVLQLFSSESDRLELAKLSYKNVVDYRNFTQLYDLFSYQGQAELDRYTRDTRY